LYLQAFALLFLLFVAACSAEPVATPTPTRVRIAGSTSLAPALHELAAAFQTRNPNVLLEVAGGGTSVGLAELRAGRVDIAALSWWDETATGREGLRLAPVARDAVAVVVHPSNPISNVTTLQLRALFGGEILDWAAFGAGTGEPAIVSREDGSGTRAAFEARIMGGQRVTLNALVMPTTQAIIEYVGTHALSAGYVSLDAANDVVRVVPLEGLLPSTESIQSGAYYLTRVLYLAAQEPPAPEEQAFLDFAQGAVGQEIIGRHYAQVR